MDFADVENMPPPRGYQGSDFDPAIARNFDHPSTSDSIAVLLLFLKRSLEYLIFHLPAKYFSVSSQYFIKNNP